MKTDKDVTQDSPEAKARIAAGNAAEKPKRKRRTKEEMAVLRAPKDPLVVIAEAKASAIDEMSRLEAEHARIGARIDALKTVVGS
jgi:hypothetical protein